MNTQTHNFANRTIETAFIKKGGVYSTWMNGLSGFFKLRSGRGYGSRKSAYSYYIRNI